MELDAGTVAVVTGAASGIGLALSDSLARAGCSIVLADVQEDALSTADEQISAHGVQTLAVPTDVTKVEQIEALAQATLGRFGGVHVVCNNAGVTTKGDPWFGPIETWRWTMDVNFWGVVHGVRTFLPLLVEGGGGHIVNTASIAGLWPGLSPSYDASKHAVVALTEDLYNTLRGAHMPVGVSCLCPGWVRTGILDADRNWPAELGAAPTSDPGQEVSYGYVRQAIDEGAQPAAVADLVVEAVQDDRFWVFPHQDFLDLAVERFHTIAERLNPAPPEELPGLPPRSQMMAEAMAAMAAALENS